MGVLSVTDEYTGPAFECIKCVPVAWFASQEHSQRRVNEAHFHSYLFKSQWNIPANSKILTFPYNDKIQSWRPRSLGNAVRAATAASYDAGQCRAKLW